MLLSYKGLKFVVWFLGYSSVQTDRQTDRQTDTLIAILGSSISISDGAFPRRFFASKRGLKRAV